MGRKLRLTIIVGHYGSGKTEFAVNYAMKMQDLYGDVAIADLDIVNPYFRTREIAERLENKGIRVISSVIGNKDSLSISAPALSPELNGLFQTEKYFGIIDVGGNPVGATALARFAHYLVEQDYNMYMVVNANRPETQSADEVIAFWEGIEDKSNLKINGIINNTHMIRQTALEDVRRGDRLAKAVSARTGIPVIYTSYIEEMVELGAYQTAGEPFAMELLMRPEWL